ncbi:unnamed protein product [Caenorhabditis auriculariae]|uniref:Uncharacterized protein n=1 Tax=Caenorhabditis auriculariae TaxID=2777116 RepID=A0A8S1HVL0_9PELO|nr:unnamed protein product [Caenorhabditis auriculariae]
MKSARPLFVGTQLQTVGSGGLPAENERSTLLVRTAAMTAKKEMNKKKRAAALNMSTISHKLTTDATLCSPPRAPEPSSVCCITVHKVAIFGISFNAIMLFSFYVYAIIRLIETAKDRKLNTEIIAVGSLIMCFVLCFSVIFVWGVLRTRQRMFIPYIVLDAFLLFAFAGTVTATLITVADEVREEINGGTALQKSSTFFFSEQRCYS